MLNALVFDLDETLVVEEPAAVAAFAATARAAADSRELEPERLALDARSKARELWYATPVHPYCARVGISSWEGLWCRFEGEGAELDWLREWAPEYRRKAWALALAEQGVDDPELAAELGERFGRERRARRETFAEADEVLGTLARGHALGLLTNGASCLQRDKLTASGLERHFAATVVSSELDSAKPDAALFRHVAELLGVDPGATAMIGDSIERDIAGALAAGYGGAVWLNRAELDADELPDGVPEIRSLSELEGALAGLGAATR